MRALRALLLSALVVFGLIATAQAQTRGDPSDCLPFAVATAPQTPGQPLPENEIVLTGVDGIEVARAEVEQPMQVIPTTFPARSIVRTLGNVYGVLELPGDDSTMGVVRPLIEFADRPSVQFGGQAFTAPDGSRFVLFHDATDLRAYLVDLISGTTLPLSDFADDSEIIISAEVSRGDEWLVLWTGRGIVLVHLATGSPPAVLGDGETASNPSFSDNGRTLYYLRNESDDQRIIVARDVESGQETLLTDEGEWFGLQHFPGDILVAQTPGGLYRIAADGTGASMLMDSNAELRPRMIDQLGSNLLVSVETATSEDWALVDLMGTGSSELPDLSGLYLNTSQTQASWALMVPSPGPRPGTAGAPYVIVNLENGATRAVLEQDSDSVYFADSSTSDDGRYTTVWDISPALGRLWLIDAQAGASELVDSSAGSAVGALTPDGCYLAVGVFDTIGEGRQGSVRIVDLQTRQTTATIEDAILLGWASL